MGGEGGGDSLVLRRGFKLHSAVNQIRPMLRIVLSYDRAAASYEVSPPPLPVRLFAAIEQFCCAPEHLWWLFVDAAYDEAPP